MIATLLDADEEEYARDMKEYYKYLDRRRTFPRFFRIWDHLFDAVMVTQAKILCKIFGHKCEPHDDWYGPDSGGFYWSCRRGCGLGGKEVLY